MERGPGTTSKPIPLGDSPTCSSVSAEPWPGAQHGARLESDRLVLKFPWGVETLYRSGPEGSFCLTDLQPRSRAYLRWLLDDVLESDASASDRQERWRLAALRAALHDGTLSSLRYRIGPTNLPPGYRIGSITGRRIGQLLDLLAGAPELKT